MYSKYLSPPSIRQQTQTKEFSSWKTLVNFISPAVILPCIQTHLAFLNSSSERWSVGLAQPRERRSEAGEVVILVRDIRADAGHRPRLECCCKSTLQVIKIQALEPVVVFLDGFQWLICAMRCALNVIVIVKVWELHIGFWSLEAVWIILLLLLYFYIVLLLLLLPCILLVIEST